MNKKQLDFSKQKKPEILVNFNPK